MAERWTKQRRLEHTRNVLLDAAEEVFARKGFDGAALEDIAEVGGYTRGASYSHCGSKAELFLSKGAARLGGHLSIPALDPARVILAANDGVTLNSLLDGQAVYRPFLRMVMANIVVPKGNNL